MKLKIQKYVNNNKKSSAYGKTYGRIQHMETLDSLDVAKHIQKHGSIFTQDVIVGVIQRFSLCIEELLQEGYKVKLEGLGTFYLSAVTEGEEFADDFNVSNIKRVRIRFLADKSKDYDWNSTSQTTRAAFSIIGNESTNGNEGGNSGSGNNGGNGGGSNNDDPEIERP